MDRLKAKAVVLRINKLFKGRHFSICEIDSLMRNVGATELPSYKTLSLYHCIDFADMDKETKAFVYEQSIANVTNIDSFPQIQIIEDNKTEFENLEVSPIRRTLGFGK